ncbi:uncharacterized protein CTHT_0025320 [Thermochaetoides thermophila DSM 1495]|uniref:TMEM205-like domain-containing protein n=1 Tax=Chaetomium thermophilum (strain DSM 1495 / CBS 144.50 / IMI 039719) TaxID=759272 RepID=G0S5Y0_CHATD|nr:hypothetical protein CTHT_0025320 [Thermochaetoides thermophila DSM 1495]EGS20696.1 hypothetical protein CTHT_0025320 [Thermochaetoides thermophila DSM 1495]
MNQHRVDDFECCCLASAHGRVSRSTLPQSAKTAEAAKRANTMGFLSPAPYHILSYGILLGTTFFHSFIGGIIAFRVLPRPQFSALMAKVFPVYFAMQTTLPLIMVLTYPAPASFPTLSGVTGVLDPTNRWSVATPLSGAFLTALANLVVVGPATTRVMRERKEQEKKDGKKSYDPGPHSPAMQALNKQFSMLHGISSLLNLGTFLSAVAYGYTLSLRLS